MFGKGKKQPNNDRCPTCGHFIVAPGKGWTPQSNTQRWTGDGADNLRQTWPVPSLRPAKVKSVTLTRLEQSLALGIAATLCTMTCALSVGHTPTLPVALSLTTIVSSGTFVLSVALGADNWQTIFRWLDRNKDGRIGLDDVRQMIDEIFPDDEPQTRDVLSPMPINTGPNKKSVPGEPAPAPAVWVGKTTADTPIMIRPAEKNREAYITTLGWLWDFIRTSYVSGWTKKAWRDRGLPYEKWKDLQDFFVGINPDWWKIENDPPTLELVLRRFCYPVNRPTNQPTDQPR